MRDLLLQLIPGALKSPPKIILAVGKFCLISVTEICNSSSTEIDEPGGQ